MADARERAAWWRTAFAVSWLVAPWCKKGEAPTPADLHPMERREKELPGSIADLRVFLE